MKVQLRVAEPGTSSASKRYAPPEWRSWSQHLQAHQATTRTDREDSPAARSENTIHRLLDHASKGELDTSFLATHTFSLEDSPKGYDMFKHKQDGILRAVFRPN